MAISGFDVQIHLPRLSFPDRFAKILLGSFWQVLGMA
jgi:hypothetical protein